MARGARRKSATGVYHVMIRGINREKILGKERERVKFLSLIRKHPFYQEGKVEIYAYCIMPNHAHFLLRAELSCLSAFMKEVQGSYAGYYNLVKERCGYVFQGRYKSECVEEERYFWNCMFYIHRNPVKAGLVKTETGYGCSSAREYESGRLDLVHENGLKMYRRKGIGDVLSGREEERAAYMDRVCGGPFWQDGICRFIMDTDEELYTQKKEAVTALLKDYVKEKNIESVFILVSSPGLKAEFLEYARKKTGCHKTEILRIISEL